MPPPSGRRVPRAAILVAVVGVVELLLFGCCTVGLAVTEPSIAELRQAPMTLPPDVTEAQLQAMARTVQSALAVGAVVLFMLPGLALLAMSPMVARGTPWAVTAARVILWGHIAIVGGMLLLNVAVSVLMLNLVSLLLTVVLLGGLLALLIWTVRSLGGAVAAGGESPEDDNFEPWNSHLM